MKKSIKNKPSMAEKFPRLNSLLFKVIVILVLALIVMCAIFFTARKITQDEIDKKSTLVSAQLEQCQELTTVKHNYMSIVTVKKTRLAGFAKAFSIVRYKGVIRAGMADISQAEIKVSKKGKKVSIKLPDCTIIGNDITQLEAFDESTSIFTTITSQDVFSEINADKEAMLLKMQNEGILDEAYNHAVKLITAMMTCAGFEEIEIE